MADGILIITGGQGIWGILLVLSTPRLSKPLFFLLSGWWMTESVTHVGNNHVGKNPIRFLNGESWNLNSSVVPTEGGIRRENS